MTTKVAFLIFNCAVKEKEKMHEFRLKNMSLIPQHEKKVNYCI